MSLEDKNWEVIGINGKIKAITQVRFFNNSNIETIFKGECHPIDIEIFKQNIKNLNDKLKFDPIPDTLVRNKNEIDLIFRGIIHPDDIGKDFTYKINTKDPYVKDYICGYKEKIIVQQTIWLPDRVYFSEFIKE